MGTLAEFDLNNPPEELFSPEILNMALGHIFPNGLATQAQTQQDSNGNVSPVMDREDEDEDEEAR